MKVKTILVSQPKPESDRSPYFEVGSKHKLTIDFRPFIHIEGVSEIDFRAERINILDHTAVIFTSRNAVDHYFRIAKESRQTIPDTMKYFCISESTAYYLQKYVVYRKRKIFHGKQRFAELIDVMKKHKKETFLLPCSDILKKEIPELLEKNKFKYSKATLYKTVCSDLSDLEDVYYDMLVFFSPAGIESLLRNFPEFKQNKTRIAVFGPTTAKAAKDAGFRIDIQAPTQNAPSMTMAIENYVKEHNKK
ncbi:MAG: uroporphyrinogen-III synthase [Salibacteraceae bacterium]